MAQVIPAILTDDEEKYHRQLLQAENASSLVQIDVVDGKFAGNKTIGTSVIKKYLTISQLEIQLMVVDPQNYIDDLVGLEQVSRIIIPFENGSGLNEAIYHIKHHNKQVGLSLNPKTAVGAALHFLDDIDLLLLLAVEPGFAGQKFQEIVIDKIGEAKKLMPGLTVEVDGGVNFENAAQIAAAGADFLAANSVLFGADDFYVAYGKLAKLAEKPQ